jgi:hypothetical protein
VTRLVLLRHVGKLIWPFYCKDLLGLQFPSLAASCMVYFGWLILQRMPSLFILYLSLYMWRWAGVETKKVVEWSIGFAKNYGRGG